MKGIDVSNHNGTVDFNQVKNDRVELVYIKATEGTTYQDEYLDRHYQGALAQGLKVGFYHFLVGTSEPETQAENFYNQIKDKQNDLKPCLDIERNGFEVMDFALRFIEKFRQLTNMDIVIYVGPYFANENLDNRLAPYPCWIAHYGVETPMDTEIWGNNYVGHQYTETGSVSGINGNCDVNNFTEGILLNAQRNVAIGDWLAEYLKTWEWTSWVKELQDECNNQGFSNQNVNGLVSTNTIEGCPTLKKGAKGNITRALQSVLKAYGFNCGDVDGDFGGKTYSAVIEYQKSRGLVADGVVGKNTWRVLLGL